MSAKESQDLFIMIIRQPNNKQYWQIYTDYLLGQGRPEGTILSLALVDNKTDNIKIELEKLVREYTEDNITAIRAGSNGFCALLGTVSKLQSPQLAYLFERLHINELNKQAEYFLNTNFSVIGRSDIIKKHKLKVLHEVGTKIQFDKPEKPN